MDSIKIILTDEQGNETVLTGSEQRQSIIENKTSKNTTVTTEKHFMVNGAGSYKVVMSNTKNIKD